MSCKITHPQSLFKKNVSGVSHEYMNSNFLPKGQAIDMSGQSIVNLGSSQGPKDPMRKKYVNENFFKKGNLIDMNQKAIKNVLPPTEEGDAATKGYVDSKSVGEIDLNMNQHSIRNTNSNPQNEDEVVPKQWIEEIFLNRYNPASTVAKDLNMDGHHVPYLRAPEQIHHAVTKGYADTKLLLLVGDMQGDIGMGGNRIKHLGEPLHDNDALFLSSANDYYLIRDGANWMRPDLSLGGRRIGGVANPQTDQDGVNLRTLQKHVFCKKQPWQPTRQSAMR